MPEVEGVGDVAHPHERRGGEKPVYPVAAARPPRDDDARSRQQRPEGDVPGKLLLDLQQQAAGEHRAEADPAEHHPHRNTGAEIRQRQGHERAEGELPQPSPRVEVGGGLIRGRLPHREGK